MLIWQHSAFMLQSQISHTNMHTYGYVLIFFCIQCHQAKILKNLYSDKNLSYLKFLKPILSDVQKVNKMFESNDADPTLLLSELHNLLKNLSYQIVFKVDHFDPLYSRLEDFFVPTPYYNYDFEKFLTSKNQYINSEMEKEIRSTCRNFIVQLIYQLRQRLPTNFLNLKNTSFFCVENSLKANKSKLHEHFKEELLDYTIESISTLEQQWQKLSLYEWTNQKSTIEFWTNVFEYKDALNENPFFELASFVMKFLVLPFSNAEVERVFSGMNLIKTKIINRMNLNTMNSLLYIRCGLKRLNVCCKNFKITNDLIKKCDKSIYYKNNLSNYSESDDEYSFDDVFHM